MGVRELQMVPLRGVADFPPEPVDEAVRKLGASHTGMRAVDDLKPWSCVTGPERIRRFPTSGDHDRNTITM